MSIPGNAEQQQIRHQESINISSAIPLKKRRESSNFSSAIPLKKRRFPVFQPCSPPQEEKDSALEDLDSKNKEESKVQDGGTSSSDAKNTDGTTKYRHPRGKKNVELSLGQKESVVSAVVQQKNEVLGKSEKLDSMSSLALDKEKLLLRDKNEDSGMGPVSNLVSADRSNWDLNTTMDVWEGSTCSEAFAHGSNIGGLNKTESCRDDKSLLTIDSTARHSSETDSIIREQHSLDGPASSLSVLSTEQCKMDDSLGLNLVMPYFETSQEHSSLSDNIDFTNGSPNFSLKQAQLPLVNVSWIVKSEPVDDNSKRDCSIGSCSSSNFESSKLSYVKRESANNHTILQSSISPTKLDDRRSKMKFEVFQECKEETCKSKAAAMLSAGRVMQHQENCASSSPTAMPVSLLPRILSPSQLPSCSELSTSGDFADQSEQSLHTKGFQGNDIPDELTAILISQESDQFRLCKLGLSNVEDKDKFELGRIDEHTVESYQNADAAENAEEKIRAISETLKESLGSDTKSTQDCAAGTVCGKEDEDYEDGEIREHVAHLAAGNAEEKMETINEMLEEESFGSDTESTQNCAVDTVFEDNSLQKSNEESERVIDEERVTNVTPDEKLDMSKKFDMPVASGQDVQETPKEEVLCDIQTDERHGIGVEIGGEATMEFVKENCSSEDYLPSPKVEECLDGQDAAKDFNNSGIKSRIINLSHPSVVVSPSRPSVPSVLTAPLKTKLITNKLLTSRSGKERYSEFDGEMQPRGNRDEFYGGSSNNFVKDQSIRNSRPSFMHGKGRGSGRFGSGRFGSSHGEWDYNPHFASERSYGRSDYRVIRRKHAPSVSDVDLDHKGYCFTDDDNSFAGNRRKSMNNEFPSLRRGSLRRVSSGDRDGSNTRGFQMINRIPRNLSPRRCSGELDNDQIVRGNRTFSTTTMQRKGYPRIRSKSPGRSRTRSPGPWSSPRRRSPNRLLELSQHRSPALYRMGRIRSPDHNACFQDDMIPRRRGSPSFVARHTNDLREIESGREQIHPRSDNSNRREEPGRFFARSNRRAEAIDSREMGDGNEFLNVPSHFNKYHELHSDGNYRPVERVWHDDGFTDARVKRRRF